jgi:hypothetical protein
MRITERLRYLLVVVLAGILLPLSSDALRILGGGLATGSGALTVTEIDGNPTGTFATLKFSNGSVTDNGDGTVSITTGAGGGGDASTNTATSVDSELVLFSGTGGKTLKRATTTGLLKGTSGVLSAASAGTDYVEPAGNVATATALAANGANCSAGQFPLGVTAAGAAESCTALPTTITGTANQITASASTGAITLSIPTSPTLPGTTTGTFSGNLTGNVTGNASTATALAANPSDCSTNEVATAIAANGNLTCTKVKHVAAFTDETIVTVAGAIHGLGTTDLLIQCWDGGTPRQLLPIIDATVDTDDFDVVLTFSTDQTGRCIFLKGA